MQFNSELKLNDVCGTIDCKNFSNPAIREMILEKDAFARMAKPLASNGLDTIYLRVKDVSDKSFFTKMELLSSGTDNTIKNVLVQFSIFGVESAKLSPFGYYIEYIPESVPSEDLEISEEKSSIITTFFDWYSESGFQQVDKYDKISRNLDVIFDPRYKIFDKSSAFDAEEFRLGLVRSFGRYFPLGTNQSVREICASAPRNKWLPPLMWRIRRVKYGKFKRTVS